MVRNIEGHGRRIINLPPIFGPTSCPFASTTAGSTPKNGSVALPGLAGIAPGRGGIIIERVLVCQHLSMMGQSRQVSFLLCDNHSSGLLVSPNVLIKHN